MAVRFPAQRLRRVVVRALLVSLAFTTIRLHQADPLQAAPAVQADPAICTGVTAIPEAECQALVALYAATDGGKWTNAAGWLDVVAGLTPCDWFGITCVDGHVTRIELPRNGLDGEIPGTLADLKTLTALDLAGNRLDGPIGPGICRLVETVADFNIDYNKVWAAGNRAADCLALLDADWQSTQTLAVDDPSVVSSTESSVTLAWTPITYQEDNGYYDVAYAPTIGGPWSFAGQTTDKSATGFTLTGLEPGQTYYARVRTVTLPHAGNSNELTASTLTGAVVTRSSEQVLLIVYFAADNDLDVFVTPLLERLRQGTLANPNAVVMALVDRAGNENTEVWRIAGGMAELDAAFLADLGVTEMDTASAASLAAFLRYARTEVPAARTLVSLLGHGVGLAPELAWIPAATPGEPDPSPRPGIPPLPRGKFATPTDVTSGTFMGTPSLGRALHQATDAGADPFDLLFFDQCFAGNLDILYEVRAAADVFIASPNYAWLSAPYTRYLAEFSPTRDGAEMANAVINVYQRSLNDAHPNAIFWLTRGEIEAVARALDDLARALTVAVGADRAPAIYRAAQASQYVDTTQCGRQNLTLGPPDEMLGAGSFATALLDEFGASDGAGVGRAAQTLLEALANVTGNARVGNPYIEPETTWDYTDTLTILAPLRRDAPADRAWRASLYRPDLAGEQAVWTAEPSQTVVISETFAYVEEGAWDDFIQAWYSGGLEPTVGEWCSYTPPALVARDDVEILPFTVSGRHELVLAWEAPLDADVAQYGLFAKRPGDVSWTLRQFVESDATTLTLTDLSGGLYRFLVAAQDDTGAYIAKTEAVDVLVTTDVFLPIAQR